MALRWTMADVLLAVAFVALLLSGVSTRVGMALWLAATFIAFPAFLAPLYAILRGRGLIPGRRWLDRLIVAELCVVFIAFCLIPHAARGPRWAGIGIIAPPMTLLAVIAFLVLRAWLRETRWLRPPSSFGGSVGTRHRARSRQVSTLLVLGGLAMPAGTFAEEDPFRDQVAPLLESRCLRCHNPEKAEGGLSLATLDDAERGGDTLPAVVPGAPEESYLLDMVAGDEPLMPRGEEPLPAGQVEALRRWIGAGAPWPEGVTLATRVEAGPTWWSLRTLLRPPVPDVTDTARVSTPVDSFLLARLEPEGLTFRPEADRRTLIRRLTFDLHGLPPTPGEVDAYVADTRPDATERLIDRLLASPRYGERWARHWLDLAHYADTHGYDKDKRRLNAWPYRDYVIDALNRDIPYDRFLREQVAGDVLDPDDPQAVIATGFVAAGPWDFVGHVELREGTVEKARTRLIDRDDMLATTMSTFVSMTVHCARCHDHKFDPIPTSDYYRLQAVFAGVDRGDRPFDDPDRRHRRAAIASERAALAADEDAIKPLPGPELGASDGGPSGLRGERAAASDFTGAPSAAELPPAAQVYALVSREPRPIHVLNRGDVTLPGERVGPGALSCVEGLDATFPDTDDEGARRAALAGWLADDRNPLTWRSIVNRVWQYHFGRGLVDTPSDFGRNGSKPTHPELLDWLAVEFRDGGKSLKDLHRLICLSAAYRQSSAHDEDAAAIDASNQLLWRQNRRRLEAEEIRDAVLFVSGRLDPAMGGPGYDLFRFVDDHSPVYDHDDPAWIDPPEGRRRTIYRFVVRSVRNPLLECLDGADPNQGVPVRNETITALQALALLNDPFVVAQAEGFADRLRGLSDDPDARIEAAYRLALGRSPRPDERDALAAYAGRHGLPHACRLLFNLNEFVFVD